MIHYLGVSSFYTGHTDQFRTATLPITVTPDHTLVAFLVCCDDKVVPIIPPDWTQVESVNDGSNASAFCFVHQPTGTTVNPTYFLGGMDSNLHGIYVMIFSGCTYDKSDDKTRLINAHASQYYPPNTDLSLTGFTTSTKDTIIIQNVGMITNTTVDTWTSNPNLAWREIIDIGFTYNSYTIHLASAICDPDPKDSYDLSRSLSSHVGSGCIAIALTPKIPNKVLSLFNM
jgi:hypothetical protein